VTGHPACSVPFEESVGKRGGGGGPKIKNFWRKNFSGPKVLLKNIFKKKYLDSTRNEIDKDFRLKLLEPLCLFKFSFVTSMYFF